MDPLPLPAPGDQCPTHPTLDADAAARAFWQLSYRCGRDYIRGRDALGRPVLVEHEREEAASYNRRLRLTKPRGFVGPILRRYNDLVFRKPPTRDPATDPRLAEVVADATGRGQPLDAFVRTALLRAQIDREAWILPDVSGAAAGAAGATVAQVQATATRPVLRLVAARMVINWREHPGDVGGGATVAEAWVVQTDAEGWPIVRVLREADYVDLYLDPETYDGSGALDVVEVRPPVAHRYPGCPAVRLRPNFDPLGDVGGSAGDSQAGPLAEAQQAIVNLVSLAREEVSNVTFSQMIAFGVSDAQVGDARVGNNRVLCVPNPAGSVSMIGADPAQAESIRAEIRDEVENLFRLAGVNPADASTAPASGLALAFRHNDLATIVAALALACEDAEAEVWRLIAGGWGVPAPARTIYQGKDPELPDFQAEAAGMAAIVANTSLPALLRRKVAERFASRNLALDEEEKAELAAQVDKTAALARPSVFPPPRRPPPGGEDPVDEDEDGV